MTVNDILKYLLSLYPLELAAGFDNCGLLVGDKTSEVTKGVVTLDCTNDTIEYAKSIGANLIVSHHPIMFSGIKQILSDSVEYKLISNSISLIAIHTNLDVANGGISDTLCKILGLENIKPIICDYFQIRIGDTKEPISPFDFAKFAAKALGTTVKYVAGNKPINKVGVCSGSGGEFIDDALSVGADAYLSADIKHHLFIDSENKGYTLIDAGHRATEDIIVEPLKDILNDKFGGFESFHSNKIKFV